MEKGKRNKLKGMTLIEILVVVTLLGVLAGVLVKSLGGSLQAGKDATVRLFATTTFKTACEGFKTVYGKYPTKDKEGDLKEFLKGSDGEVAKDPWGLPYTVNLPSDEKNYKEINLQASQGAFSKKAIFPFADKEDDIVGEPKHNT